MEGSSGTELGFTCTVSLSITEKAPIQGTEWNLGHLATYREMKPKKRFPQNTEKRSASV